MQRRHVRSFYPGLHVRKGFVLMEEGGGALEKICLFCSKIWFHGYNSLHVEMLLCFTH